MRGQIGKNLWFGNYFTRPLDAWRTKSLTTNKQRSSARACKPRWPQNFPQILRERLTRTLNSCLTIIFAPATSPRLSSTCNCSGHFLRMSPLRHGTDSLRRTGESLPLPQRSNGRPSQSRGTALSPSARGNVNGYWQKWRGPFLLLLLIFFVVVFFFRGGLSR